MTSDLIGVALLWCLFLMSNRRAKVPKGQIIKTPLSLSEKIQVWIISFLNPIWGGAIFYFGWRNRLPTKAKQANRISFFALGIEAVLVIIGLIAYSYL